MDKRRKKNQRKVLKRLRYRIPMPPSNSKEYRRIWQRINRFLEKQEKKNGKVHDKDLEEFLKQIGITFTLVAITLFDILYYAKCVIS